MNALATRFDYASEGLTDLSVALERHADKITAKQESVRKIAFQSALTIGAELCIARDRLANHGDGCFRKWATERCGLSNSTVSNVINLYREFGHLEGGDLPTIGKTLDLTTLYLLASDKCPEDVTREVIERAKAGEPVTKKEVQQAIAATVADDDEPTQPAAMTGSDGPADSTAPDADAAGSLTQDDPHAFPFVPEYVTDQDAVEPLAAEDTADTEEDGGQDAGKEAPVSKIAWLRDEIAVMRSTYRQAFGSEPDAATCWAATLLDESNEYP
jgi:hypothetical protein